MNTPIISEDSLNPSVYNLAEIWPFEMINVTGLRMGGGGGGDVSIAESSNVVTEQRNYSLGTMKRKHGNSKDKDEEDDLNNFNRKQTKLTGSRDENGGSKSKNEANSEPENKLAKQSTQFSESPKQDYILVRARRGQATDSHSLAERARRVKISERMKILQDLVPGCNKIIGKALVLDEIINYIQSLQSQVEFLSTKLEAVNSWMSSPTERFSSKELGIPIFDATGILFGSQAAREYMQASQSELLLMQLGSTFNRPT